MTRALRGKNESTERESEPSTALVSLPTIM